MCCTVGRSDQSVITGGRVRSGPMKELLAKQLGAGLNQLENGQPLMDLKTGKIASKKNANKKEKSAEQKALAEAKTLNNKFRGIQSVCLFSVYLIKSIKLDRNPWLRLKKLHIDIPKCIDDIQELEIRNSEELVPWYNSYINFDHRLLHPR